MRAATVDQGIRPQQHVRPFRQLSGRVQTSRTESHEPPTTTPSSSCANGCCGQVRWTVNSIQTAFTRSLLLREDGETVLCVVCQQPFGDDPRQIAVLHRSQVTSIPPTVIEVALPF